MLDIKFIRENPDKVKEGCRKKQVKVDIDKLLELYEKQKKILQKIENLRAKRKKLSGLNEENLKVLKEIKQELKKLEPEHKKIEEEYQKLMLMIPNLPLDEVPEGKDENDNVVIKEVGKKTPKAQDYLDIAEKLDLIDVKRASKVSGSRFGYLKKEVVLLHFALIKLAFDILTKEGFVPVLPPVLISKKAMQAMGYWDRGKEEIYYFEKDDLCLIGTSEQSIGPMHMNEIIKDLPKRYIGFSTCFRREAGSYGKDTRGIFRVHQFDKVEMFSFSHPEKSRQEHKFLLSMQERLMQELKLPYRIVQLCTGDLGNAAAATYDIETWLPSQQRYRETHSTSNCTDFQARRLNIRYEPGKFVHTLNGTAFATGRMIIAILENYQQKDGSIKVPSALQKYTGFKRIR
jgi:seryl-tRNA synthetase